MWIILEEYLSKGQHHDPFQLLHERNGWKMTTHFDCKVEREKAKKTHTNTKGNKKNRQMQETNVHAGV